MQTQDPPSDVSTVEAAAGGPGRILADPNRVVVGPDSGQVSVYSHGTMTAILDRHFNSLYLVSDDPPFSAQVYDFDALNWTQTGALLRIQGEHTLDILGPAICVLRGKHRPIWDPRPGMDEVRVVVPTFNPQGLRPLEIFQLATRLGF